MWCYQICRGPGTIVDIHWMLLMFRNGSPNWRSLFTESHFPGWVGRRISGSFHFLSGCDRRLFFSARPKAAHFVPQKVIPQPRQRTERQYEIGDPHAQGCERHSVVCTQKQWCKYITYSTSLCSIRVVLHPDPARLRTTERTLSHTWLTSFTAPTEQDLCGLRENFDPRARWRNAIGVACVLSRFGKCNGANNDKRTTWHSARTMRMITGAEVGRRRGARRQNHTPRDSSTTFHLHRRMIARFGAGWWDWQRGFQRRCRHHRSLQCHFLIPSTRPRPLQRLTRHEKGTHSFHRRRRRTSLAEQRKRKK